MSNQSEPAFRPSPFRRLIQRWQDRLYAGRVVLSAVALVLVLLIAFGNVPLVAALGGWVLIAVVLVLWPPIVGRGTQQAVAAALGEDVRLDILRRLAGLIEDAFIVVDGRALIVHANPAAVRQFPPASVGDPLAFSLRHPVLLPAIEAARNDPVPQTVEFQLPVPADTFYRARISRVDGFGSGPGAPGRPLVAIVLNNLSDQRRIDAMRADFIANASHELRTPLTALSGFIETLQGPAAHDEEAREKFLGIMSAQAERMSGLIDDLLSLSRIERLQFVLPTEEVDLREVVKMVREAMAPRAEAEGLNLLLTAPDAPALVTGKQSEIYEAFENLVDNAIKYGATGDRVEIHLAPVEDGQRFAYRANVVDFGAGVASEHVPRLTERFYRVDADTSRKKKGTGLGLAIVKHIMARHRGELRINSTPGSGTNVELMFAR